VYPDGDRKNAKKVMKEISDVVACVVDFGMFMPVAMKLSKFYKKVYYSTPTEKGFQVIDDFVMGDGVTGITRLEDYLSPSVFDEIDLFVFPYILYSGLQEHLEACGKAVWGARRADELETMKGKFYDSLEEVGLTVPGHEKVRGMKNLRVYLKEHPDVFVKISRYRGTMDTWKHVDYTNSSAYLDMLAVKLGPFQDDILFYVIDKIDTPIEGGIDTYNIDGQWPGEAVLGYEKKNECYLATVKPMAEMPPEFSIVNELYGPVLARYNYRQFFSTEVRVDGKDSIFIDPTCRTASPAGEEMLDLFGNLGDIVWQGAHGVLAEPEITARFAGEAYLHWTGERKQWKCLTVPEGLPAEVKLYACAQKDGVYYSPPDDEDVIGCVVAIGDDPGEVIEKIKETCEGMIGSKVRADLASFADLLIEIKKGEEAGIEFTDKNIPDPSVVLDSAV
jgi:hypothetical protein